MILRYATGATKEYIGDIEMKRRDFLKKVGLVACGLQSMGVIAEIPKTTSIYASGNVMTVKKVNEYCLKCLSLKPRIEPVEMNGEKYFCILMHPRQKYDLDVLIAREKYKHERWVERYNRWAQTQGKPSYQKAEGEFVSW